MKIFLTVGTQLPFDRLVALVDSFALTKPHLNVYGQIGTGSYVPANFPFARSLQSAQYQKRFAEADVIVSHAGMGTIISAHDFKKPLLMMPRSFEHGEHRNDHQIATWQRFKGRRGLYFFQSEAELSLLLRDAEALVPCDPVLAASSGRLTNFLKSYINDVA